MPNVRPNRAVEYLRQNKDKYPLDVLKQKLVEAGYPKEAIDRAILEVFRSEFGRKQRVISRLYRERLRT